MNCCLSVRMNLQQDTFYRNKNLVTSSTGNFENAARSDSCRASELVLTQQIWPPLCTLLYHLYLNTWRASDTPSSGTSSPLTVVEVPLRTCKYGSSVTPQTASEESFIETIVRAMKSSRGPYRHCQSLAESITCMYEHSLRTISKAALGCSA